MLVLTLSSCRAASPFFDPSAAWLLHRFRIDRLRLWEKNDVVSVVVVGGGDGSVVPVVSILFTYLFILFF